MNTIELDVQLELPDFLRATYWFFFRRTKSVLILLLIALVVYPLLVYAGRIPTSPTDSNWGFLIPPVMLLFLLVSPYFGARRQMKSNRSLNQRIHYIINEAGLETLAPSCSGQMSWANIYKAYETRSNFLLFISKNMMYTIPKRCFVNGQQMEQFRQLLRSQLKSKAKLK